MQVTLLCVEEKWAHRPSMLEVSTMLSNENANLPIPRRPAFSINKDEEEKSTAAKEVFSINIATISKLCESGIGKVQKPHRTIRSPHL